MTLIFSSRFEDDFAELVSKFAEAAGEDLAMRFEEQVIRLTRRLLRFPEMGRLRHDLKPEGIRSFMVPQFHNYLLFYQVKGEELVLLRVRYGGMNLPLLFGES
jgi:addiction module RelE/StbE family toxin